MTHLRLLQALSLAFMALLAAGCSQPRLDTSSDEAFHRSVAQISASLSGTEKAQFDGMMAAQTLSLSMFGRSPAEAFSEFDGLEATALLQALNQRAEEVRKRRDVEGRR